MKHQVFQYTGEVVNLGQRAGISVVLGVIWAADHESGVRITIFAQNFLEMVRETSKWSVHSKLASFGQRANINVVLGVIWAVEPDSGLRTVDWRCK